MIPRLVLFRGAGDLATGAALRLWQAGFETVMLELEQPLVVRRTVSFASAIFDGSIIVEGIRAEHCTSAGTVFKYLEDKTVPVLIDPLADSLDLLKPKTLVDATMSKRNLLTKITDADLVIGLGPGFTAGMDVNAIVETKRGHDLGKVLYEGTAARDTGEPGIIAGYGKERLLRAPIDGVFMPVKEIGDLVEKGDVVAAVEGLPVSTEIDGIIRGLLYPELVVKKGTKIGDIDPRGAGVDCLTVSDKARAIGGGVLEAIMHHYFYS